MNREFDHENFCVRVDNLEEINVLERFISPLRPDDWEYPPTYDVSTPYYGVCDNELYISSVEFGEEYSLKELSMYIMKFKLQSILDKTREKIKVGIHRWEPQEGDTVLASITGEKYTKSIYMYTAKAKDGKDRYYGIPVADITPTHIDEGQRTIKLTAFKRLKPFMQ